jgi:hypothetical protein
MQAQGKRRGRGAWRVPAAGDRGLLRNPTYGSVCRRYLPAKVSGTIVRTLEGRRAGLLAAYRLSLGVGRHPIAVGMAAVECALRQLAGLDDGELVVQEVVAQVPNISSVIAGPPPPPTREQGVLVRQPVVKCPAPFGLFPTRSK